MPNTAKADKTSHSVGHKKALITKKTRTTTAVSECGPIIKKYLEPNCLFWKHPWFDSYTRSSGRNQETKLFKVFKHFFWSFSFLWVVSFEIFL